MIGKDIKSSYVCARRYVERCCIEVEQDGQVIQAFTEREGKNRVTDWGGQALHSPCCTKSVTQAHRT